MSGILIEYLLGLYFAISALGWSYPERRFAGDGLRFIIGVVLIIFAIIGFSPVH